MVEIFDIAGYTRISFDDDLDRDNTSIENQKDIQNIKYLFEIAAKMPAQIVV